MYEIQTKAKHREKCGHLNTAIEIKAIPKTKNNPIAKIQTKTKEREIR